MNKRTVAYHFVNMFRSTNENDISIKNISVTVREKEREATKCVLNVIVRQSRIKKQKWKTCRHSNSERATMRCCLWHMTSTFSIQNDFDSETSLLHQIASNFTAVQTNVGPIVEHHLIHDACIWYLILTSLFNNKSQISSPIRDSLSSLLWLRLNENSI